MDNDFGGRSAFHTLKGYQMLNTGDITESMEDYLEMISRHVLENGYIRMSFLADKLNVRPSSASKMVGKLRDMGFVKFEKYGLISLTDKGKSAGEYLLWRHNVLKEFFCLLNRSEDELEQVEMVEHFLSRTTIENLELLIPRMRSGW